MKNVLLGILMIASSFASAHVPGMSFLEIRSKSGPVSISINRQTPVAPSMLYSVPALPPGNHLVEVYSAAGCHHFGPHEPQCRQVLLYSGNIYVQPGTRVSAVYEHKRGIRIKQVQTIGAPAVQGYPTWQPNYGYAYSPMTVISRPAFEAYLGTIDNQWTDSNRLLVAKQGLQYHFLTTAMVIEVMEEFWTESARLEFAKAAYTRVVDPQYYYLVNEVFWHSSSVQELDRFIRGF